MKVAYLKAVVEACGLERLPLTGIFQGCTLCTTVESRLSSESLAPSWAWRFT